MAYTRPRPWLVPAVKVPELSTSAHRHDTKQINKDGMYLLKDFKREMTMPMHTANLLLQQNQRRTASRSTNPNRHVRDVQWITSSGTKPTPITRGTTSRENRFAQLYGEQLRTTLETNYNKVCVAAEWKMA